MEHVRTVEACRRVLGAAFPGLLVGEVRYLAEGWDSTVFEVDGGLVFRFPKRAPIDAMVRKEIRLLPVLGPRLPAAIPRFAHVSGPVLDYPWHVVGYRKLGGTFLDALAGTRASSDGLAEDLAAFLRALHAFPPDEAAALGAPVFTAAAWASRHENLFAVARTTAEGRATPAASRAFAAYWEAVFADAESFAFEPVLVHGDLAAAHVLVDGGGRLGGVIDFGDAMVADPALDFAGFADLLAQRTLERYSVDADVRHGIWRRRSVYRRAAALHAISAGIELEREDLVDEGIEAIEESVGS